MRPALPPSPTEKEWAHLGFTDAVELAGGKQSRVFAARAEIGPVAVKLTDATLTNKELMETRSAFVAELATIDHSVLGPVEIQQRLVYPLGAWLVTATDHWITNLADAPIGIRSSSPAWIDVLKQFVKTWSELS